jgi:hypothetical protein
MYELTQAIARYRRPLLIGFGLLALLVLVLTFTYEDGSIGWRGGSKWESSFQISVVSQGTKSLSNPETGDNVRSAAAAYADLLASGEAAEAIGEMSGFVLVETLSVDTNPDAAIIGATVVGPSAELAKSAARNAFAWLVEKIQQPLEVVPSITTVPPTTGVAIDGPFASSLTVEVDDSLDSVSTDVFVLVDTGGIQQMALLVASRAGTSVSAAALLEPSGSVVLSLEQANGTPYDSLRLSPDPLPRSAPGYPSLVVRLGPTSIRSSTGDNADQVWLFAPEAIATEWIEGSPIPQPVAGAGEQVQVSMLTDEPSVLQIGGRRGPLVGFAVLLVGMIGLLAAVIVADTWRRDRDELEVAPPGTPAAPDDEDSAFTLEILSRNESEATESTQSDQ